MGTRFSNNKDNTTTKGGTGITAGGDVYFGDVSGQVAIGKFINQFKIEKPSGEALKELITFLDQRREDAFNKQIFTSYSHSTLPDYPSKLKEFVTANRVEEITNSLIYLQEDHRLLLVSGVGGVGKTTLARALVETRPANVPPPFWFDFSKKMDATLGDILEKLASYLNMPDIVRFKDEAREAGQDDINRLTDELHKRDEIWLVFDNLETILDDRHFHDEGIDKLFTSLRGSTDNAKIIVTSRVIPELKNGNELINVLEKKKELEGLSIPHAVYYLQKNGFGSEDQKVLEKIAEDVDGHPFALELLVGIANDMGVGIALNEIELYRKQKLTKIKIHKKLFDKLAGAEKELLERISVFRKPESISALKIMFKNGTSVEDVLKLKRKSLLRTNEKDNFWLHPLVQEFAYDDLENKIEAHNRASRYYLSLSLPEPRMKKEDVQSLIEAHYHACLAQEYDTAADILFDYNLHEDLDRWGHSRTLIEIYSGLLSKDPFKEKPVLTSIGTHGSVLGNLGSAYSDLGQVDKAIEYHEQALVIAREIGDRRGEGSRLGNLGSAYYHLGQVEKAIEYYEQALVIAREIGDRRGEGADLGNLGSAYYQLGQVDKDIEYHEQALVIFREIGDRHGEGNELGNLGLAYYQLGQVDKAIEYYEQALVIAREIGDRRGEGADLGNLGSAYYQLGQVDKDIEYHEQALVIFREIGDRHGEGNELGNLGLAYYQLGQVDKAIEYYEQALVIAREIGDRRGEGADLGNLGSAYYQLGQVDKAIEYYEQALVIFHEIGNRRNERNWIGNLGSAYYHLGQVEKAIEYYEQALIIGKEIKDPRIINFCEKNLESINMDFHPLN